MYSIIVYYEINHNSIKNSNILFDRITHLIYYNNLTTITNLKNLFDSSTIKTLAYDQIFLNKFHSNIKILFNISIPNSTFLSENLINSLCNDCINFINLFSFDGISLCFNDISDFTYSFLSALRIKFDELSILCDKKFYIMITIKQSSPIIFSNNIDFFNIQESEYFSLLKNIETLILNNIEQSKIIVSINSEELSNQISIKKKCNFILNNNYGGICLINNIDSLSFINLNLIVNFLLNRSYILPSNFVSLTSGTNFDIIHHVFFDNNLYIFKRCENIQIEIPSHAHMNISNIQSENFIYIQNILSYYNNLIHIEYKKFSIYDIPYFFLHIEFHILNMCNNCCTFELNIQNNSNKILENLNFEFILNFEEILLNIFDGKFIKSNNKYSTFLKNLKPNSSKKFLGEAINFSNNEFFIDNFFLNGIKIENVNNKILHINKIPKTGSLNILVINTEDFSFISKVFFMKNVYRVLIGTNILLHEIPLGIHEICALEYEDELYRYIPLISNPKININNEVIENIVIRYIKSSKEIYGSLTIYLTSYERLNFTPQISFYGNIYFIQPNIPLVIDNIISGEYILDFIPYSDKNYNYIANISNNNVSITSSDNLSVEILIEKHCIIQNKFIKTNKEFIDFNYIILNSHNNNVFLELTLNNLTSTNYKDFSIDFNFNNEIINVFYDMIFIKKNNFYSITPEDKEFVFKSGDKLKIVLIVFKKSINICFENLAINTYIDNKILLENNSFKEGNKTLYTKSMYRCNFEDANTIISCINNGFDFIPEIFINDNNYTVPFGIIKQLSLPNGIYNIKTNLYEDNNYIYFPSVIPEKFIISDSISIITITYTKKLKKTNYIIDFFSSNLKDNSYEFEIHLTNNNPTPLSNLILEFDFIDDIISISNARINSKKDHYIIHMTNLTTINAYETIIIYGSAMKQIQSAKLENVKINNISINTDFFNSTIKDIPTSDINIIFSGENFEFETSILFNGFLYSDFTWGSILSIKNIPLGDYMLYVPNTFDSDFIYIPFIDILTICVNKISDIHLSFLKFPKNLNIQKSIPIHNLPEHIYAPIVNINDNFKIKDSSICFFADECIKNNIKYVILESIVSNDYGLPSFSGMYDLYPSITSNNNIISNQILNEIYKLREFGGDIILSFGNNKKQPLSSFINNKFDLMFTYLSIIKFLSLKHINFNFSNIWRKDLESYKRNNLSLLLLQKSLKKSNHLIYISFTFNSSCNGIEHSFDILKDALSKGLKISVIYLKINIHGFFIYNFIDLILRSINSSKNQIIKIYNDLGFALSDSDFYKIIGIIIDISNLNSFSIDDIYKFFAYCNFKNIKIISINSLFKDSNLQSLNKNLEPYLFSNIFKNYTY